MSCSVYIWDGDESWIEIEDDLDYMDACLIQEDLELKGAVSIVKIDGMLERQYWREHYANVRC